MTDAERTDFIKSLGQPAFRAKQIEEWLYDRAVLDYNEMTNLPLQLRNTLVGTGVPLVSSVLIKEDKSPSAVKLAIQMADGQIVETVIMFYHHGVSLCVSSQVGCKMGCGFCASGQGGYTRNLSASEMVAQLLLANNTLRLRGERVSHIVMMGMGEPLDNYEETMKFIRIVSGPRFEISPRRITISTCGLIPQIERLALEGLPITLSVSLHAPNGALRESIMPIAKLHPYNQLLAALQYYQRETKRRVTVEYTLIKGLNDSDKHALELVSRIKGSDFHVNLIPVNPIADSSWERPTIQRSRRFKEVLVAAGINATLRREIGSGISGSCGQLRRSLT